MALNPVLTNFSKTYLPGPGKTFKHTATLRHKGTVIAFAMDSERRIRYTVLSLSDNPADPVNTAPPSPFDRDAWLASPQELFFPSEIAEVGFDVAGNTLLPVFRKNKATAEALGSVLPAPERGGPMFDYFKSSTARLSADAAFQVLSDGQYIYLFRRAVDGNDANNVLKTNADNILVKDHRGQTVSLVNATLLLDRFMLVGTQLQPKMEVRFQRSRSKTRPANRKDSLGAKDLDGNPFFEPTQELKFVGNLHPEGRFSVLLLPTAVAGLQRWQIFAENSQTGRMDSFNVERSRDGLFNTRGTADANAQNKGYAESALQFTESNAHITIDKGPVLGGAFTIEAWLKPPLPKGDTEPLALISSLGSVEASRAEPSAAPSIWIDRGTRLRVGFGSGPDGMWFEYTSKPLLTPDDWNHIAVSFDGATLRFFANGKLRESTQTAHIYAHQGQLQTDNDGAPILSSFTAKISGNTLRQPSGLIGNQEHSFSGILDEIRVWGRARSQSELSADHNHRLTGLEPDLLAYWNFDERGGNRVLNMVGNEGEGTLQKEGSFKWVASDAPVGEQPGLQRDSFIIPQRHFTTGPASLLYYQQSSAATGYDGKKKPLKQSGRVMLAACTEGGDKTRKIAALDFGVSASGRLAQIPDSINLAPLAVTSASNASLNDNLEAIAKLQAQHTLLDEDVTRLTPVLTKLNTALAEPLSTANITTDIVDNALGDGLNEQLTALNKALIDLKKAQDDQLLLDAAFNNARVTAFLDDLSGATQVFPAGTHDLTGTLRGQLSSLRINGPLQVVLMDGQGNRSTPFSGDEVPFSSLQDSGWNDRAVQLEITETPQHAALRKALSAAQTAVTKIQTTLTQNRDALKIELETKTVQRATVLTNLNEKKALVTSGASAVMPLVAIDALGLGISGGLLGFAWSKSTPLLFDSATGSLAMYFQGTDDQFFVAYYDTRTERARYELTVKGGPFPLLCIARTADADMDKIEIEVADTDGDETTCQVIITGPGDITETWRKVPRNPSSFAKVLNGQAEERAFLGSGTLSMDGTTLNFDPAGPGAKRAIPKGATIAVGDVRFVVQQAVTNGAQQISLKKTDPRQRAITIQQPVFFIGYDYSANADTTNLVADLYNGSLYLAASFSGKDDESQHVENQLQKAGITLSSQWTADAPGTTLHFDGREQRAESAHFGDAANIKSFSPANDVTLETWARPSRVSGATRLLHHRSDSAAYALGLEKQELASALNFRGPVSGVEDALIIPAVTGIDPGNTPHTIEAWIRIDELPVLRSAPIFFGSTVVGSPNGSHHWLINPNGEIQIGAAFLDGQLTPKLPMNQWVHVASVFDGKELSVFFNGLQQGSNKSAVFNLPAGMSLKIGAANSFGIAAFKGQIDDVRIWKRARTNAEMLADMNRRLGGMETGLVGYWHFEDRTVTDYSRNKNHGALTGSPALAASPISAYKVFAGANGQMLRSKQVLPAGNWAHLAAVCVQDLGLKFDGESGFLDCGKEESLNLNADLTLEVFLHADAANATDWGAGYAILSKGKIDDGTTQNTPYALSVNANGQIVFSYENVLGANISFVSTAKLEANKPHRVTVTRRVKTKSLNKSGDISLFTFGWHEIAFHIDDLAVETRNSLFDHARANDILTELLKPSPSFDAVLGFVTAAALAALGGVGRFVVADIGRSNQPLRVGSDYRNPLFNGVISELRIWNVARERADILKELAGSESGLVALWRFQEKDGKTTQDSIGSNHASLIGGIKRVNAPGSVRSQLTLFINGEKQQTEASTLPAPLNEANQFTLGGLRKANGSFAEPFQGELEELRIWKTKRNEEQIQDNLFRSLVERKKLGDQEIEMIEEQEDLLAYYTFDANPLNLRTIGDRSLLNNQLTVAENPTYVLSTAPISSDAPLVRSALAGMKNTFNGLVQTTPTVHEYADMQVDSSGNLVGVFKRCYGFIADDQWTLVTGYKLGDMAAQWIGQVQFAPELIGFIEGAPPVPSENLTNNSDEAIGDLDDYNQASTVELVEAEEVNYIYASTSEKGFDVSLDAKLGVKLDAELTVGFGAYTKTVGVEGKAGVHLNFEQSLGWLDNASTSVGRASGQATSVELRGRFSSLAETEAENAAARKNNFGRRFTPFNLGQALVRSETADVFALRLLRNGALISYQMKPNPDIPKDWNILSFPINPSYTKQGTLDGKIGLEPDVDYPNALTYSADSSYFKPIEAYALKNKINRDETILKTYYEQYAAGLLGIIPIQSPLPQLHKRNLVNTYVWTSDGGLFAETLQTMDAKEEVTGGSYSFKGMVGAFAELDIAIGGVGIAVELDALLGGHITTSVTKAKTSQSSFGLNISLDKVERDIYQRVVNAAGDLEIATEATDSKHSKPVKTPGKVDAYRFLSFYLEPNTEHYDLFFSKIIDPIWLEQSDDPAAVALRGARQPKKKPACWRVMHRVTYISRVLPPLDLSAPPSLEKTLQTLDVESNYELIKLLEPYVADKIGNFSDFSNAVEMTLARLMPELLPHSKEVKQYLNAYFGLADADHEAQGALTERVPNLPPIVNAGADQPLNSLETPTELDATVIDDRLDRVEDIFVTWEKTSGPDAAVVFEKPNAAQTKAIFSKRGRYDLRLTASDGTLQASDHLTVIINERPVVSAGANQDVAAVVVQGVTVLKTQLKGSISDDGLGDPETGTVTVKWSKKSGLGEVTFVNEGQLDTEVIFPGRGHYLLQLSVNNGVFTTTSEVLMAVAARVTRDLQALYVFEENGGTTVRDVSGAGAALDLQIADLSKATRNAGFLTLNDATTLATTGAATRLSTALKLTNEISLEVWLTPNSTNLPGLGRILTFSDGPAARNFTLGQNDGSFQFRLRTTPPLDLNANGKTLTGGNAEAGKLTHLIVTRDTTGLARMYVNGVEVANRMVSGLFSNWTDTFQLLLGNEAGGGESRAWLGELHLAAIYARALSPDEIKQNFEFLTNANLPPVVSAGANEVVDWKEFDWNLPIQKKTIDLKGRVTHDREEQGSILWEQIGGPTNGVSILDKSAAQTKVEVIQKGRYAFRLTATDGALTTSDEVTITVHCPPHIEVKPEVQTQHLALSSVSNSTVETKLVAVLKDSGRGDEPDNGQVNFRWTWPDRQSPASTVVQIAEADQAETNVRFSQRNLFKLKLEVDNGRPSLLVPLFFNIGVHQMPVLSAATLPASAIVTLPVNLLTLNGAVPFNGLANPADPLQLDWSLVNGPEGGTVLFADPTKAQTTATFDKGGLYTLRLTATNRNVPALSASAEIRATLNTAPVVELLPIPSPLILRPLPPSQPQGIMVNVEAIVSDDGLPETPGALTLKWSQTGPAGGLSILPDNSDFAEARFTKRGKYVLTLEANDGVASSSKQATVVVHAPPVAGAGANLVVKAPINAPLQLDGGVSENGLGEKPAVDPTTFLWEKVSGPGEVKFSDPTAKNAKVTLLSPNVKGTYVLKLTADNGFVTGSSTMNIVVS